MSGEQDRRGARPADNPFFVDDDAPRPVPRAKRGKPPPAVITAGGVDMARAHAAGIRIREPGVVPRVDEPRVVLRVETDPRRIRTPRRLLEGRDAGDGTRAALLPLTPSPVAAAPGAPTTQVRAAAAQVVRMPTWARVIGAAVIVAIVAGLARRAHIWLTSPPPPPPSPAATPAPPPPPAPKGTEPVAAEPPPEAAPQASPPPRRPKPAPRPAFTPLFELPGAKPKR